MTHVDGSTIPEDQRIFINDAAELLNRKPATIRMWERTEALPDELRGYRTERGWRFWTPEQIEGIKTWLDETRRFPGQGLGHYDPSPGRLDKHLERMRKRRRPNPVEPDGATP